MAETRFEANPAGLTKLLKSPEVIFQVGAYTQGIGQAANATLEPDREAKGYVSFLEEKKTRVRGRVITVGRYARRSNAVHNTLVRALHGAAG